MRILQSIHRFDLLTFDWCLKRKHREPFINLSRWISWTANGHLYLVATLYFALLSNWQLLNVMVVAFSVERLLYFLLKNKLKRNRPQQAIPDFISVIQPSDQFSFPSGHTSAAFLMMGIISAFFPSLMPILLVWAIWVGISRVILGVHFPTDTFAGASMGFMISQACLSLLV